MNLQTADFENVTQYSSSAGCFPCNPCSPDQRNDDGSQCYPCNPCSPDRLGKYGSQCSPCNPCSPDQRNDDGSQCYPCNPCSLDRAGAGGSRCSPCNPCSPDQSNGSYGRSDGCFISSACTESCGLPDNCDELRTLRAFRDKRRLYDEKFDLLVKEYYRIAPRIVDKIEKSSDAKAEYARLYHELVTPCVAMIKANRENDAVKLYVSTVLELEKAYLGMA